MRWKSLQAFSECTRSSARPGLECAASAQAAEPGKYATPDWRTNEPGPRANDLYAEQSGFNDEDNFAGPPLAECPINFRLNLYATTGETQPDQKHTKPEWHPHIP